jgi:hypothetical protein
MGRRVLPLVAVALLAASSAAPSVAAPRKQLSMALGSTLTITGRTGSLRGAEGRATGRVVLSGRSAGGRWRVLATTATDSSGKYRLVFTPHRRGTVTLRIDPPDRHPQSYVLHVS